MGKIATSIEQSRKFLELGLSPDTADMYWRYDHNIHTHDDTPRLMSSVSIADGTHG